MSNATLERIQREANEAQETMNRIRDGGTPPAPSPAPAPAPASADDIPPAPNADNDFGRNQVVTPIGDDDTPPGESGPISAADFARLQQQLSTMQGRMDAQAAQLAEANGRTQVLQQMLALKSQAEEAAPPPAPRERKKIANPKLVEEYGEELVGLVRDLIREDLEFTVEPLSAQIQAVSANVTQLMNGYRGINTQMAQQSQNAFERALDTLVVDAKGKPDWSDIDSMHTRGDRRFIDWLQKPSEDTGEVRQNAIKRLYQQQDAQLVARMFNKFKAEFGLPDGTATDSSANTPPNPAAALVSPSPSGSSTPPASNRGRPRTYKMSEINKHYDDKTKGAAWKGKEVEWKRIADEMDKAVREGRVEYDIR